MTTGYVILSLLILIGSYGIYAYNSLVRHRNLVSEGWSGIDVQLKRRADLIPNLVEVVKGYADHESNLFKEIIALRNKALAGGTITDQAQTGKAMAAALGKLIALAENYPDLKADTNFRKLQEQLAQIEDELQMARRYYNGAVRNFNTMIEQLPSNIIAGWGNFSIAEYFQLDNEADRQVPNVTFEGKA